MCQYNFGNKRKLKELRIMLDYSYVGQNEVMHHYIKPIITKIHDILQTALFTDSEVKNIDKLSFYY